MKRTKITKKRGGILPHFLKKEQNEIRTERHRPSYIFGKKRLCKNMKRFLSFQYPETLKRPSQVSKRYPKNTFFIKIWRIKFSTWCSRYLLKLVLVFLLWILQAKLSFLRSELHWFHHFELCLSIKALNFLTILYCPELGYVMVLDEELKATVIGKLERAFREVLRS